MIRKLAIVFSCFILLTIGLDYVYSDCCVSPIQQSPLTTIGRGDCNRFCCDCSAKCRNKVIGSVHGDAFKMMDTNNDNQIGLQEIQEFLSSGLCGNPDTKLQTFEVDFKALDFNGDGFLSRQEIDSKYKPHLVDLLPNIQPIFINITKIHDNLSQ